jgi:transcription elongation GreA/GreB family factor
VAPGRIRDMTRRIRGFSLQQSIKELKPYIVGWRGYFGLPDSASPHKPRSVDPSVIARARPRLRRNAVAAASRDMRYFAERLRTAQLMPDPVERDTVAFGSRVTFARDDGRRQTFRIVGEDEADPRAGSISYVSPVARALIGKAVADRVVLADHEIEVLAIE